MRVYRLLLLPALSLLAPLFLCAQSELKEKQLQTSLRMIGHQLLLQSSDSNSRVLPLESDSNQYLLRFDTKFALNPDVLINIVDSVMKQNQQISAYVVEVLNCKDSSVVHSHSVSRLDSNYLLACKGRALPKDCYMLLFSLEYPAAVVEIVPTAKPTEKAEAGWLKLIPFIVGGILLLFLWFLRNRRSSKQKDPKAEPQNDKLIYLGNYRFDQDRSELILKDQRTELSHKEANLLVVLHNSLNKTLEREYILNQVWGDEGDYVGRTLDVFISKLRKKLEGDPNIKISNVRGVGYKLVIG